MSDTPSEAGLKRGNTALQYRIVELEKRLSDLETQLANREAAIEEAAGVLKMAFTITHEALCPPNSACVSRAHVLVEEGCRLCWLEYLMNFKKEEGDDV